MYKHNVFCSVSLIVLSILAVHFPDSAMFAREPEPAVGDKKTTFPFSIVAAITSPAQESRTVKVNVDVNEERKEGKKSYHNLIGWVFVKDQETRGQKVYVQLEKPDGKVVHYSTIPMERPEVGPAYKNPFYNHSGFYAKIPLKDGLDIDVCTIRFVVKNRNGIYKSRAWKFGISSRAEIMLEEHESRAVKVNVDVNKERKEGKKSYHNLIGWVFVENQDTRGQKVYVQFEKPDGTVLHYSAWSYERPEVGPAYKNPFYNHSGFYAKIPLKDGLDVDTCTIRFVVKNKSGIYKSRIWRSGISSRVEITPSVPVSRLVIFYLDANVERKENNRSYHYLAGWVYVKDQETRGQKVYVQIGNPDGSVVHYSTMSLERTDVGTGFNNPLYNASGFNARIPLKDGLDIAAGIIRLVVKNRNGIYVSHEWKEGLGSSATTGKLSFFVVVNWLLVIITCMILIAAIWRDRSLLLKPSIMVVLFFHVMCQWGSAIDAGRIESALPQPWIFVLLSQGFPLIGLIVSLFTARGTARHLWGRITADNPVDPARKTWAWAILAVCFAGFIAIYLSHVQFRSTGLYTIFSSPLESGLARDMSVKFLDNAFLRYGHNIVMAVFAPLLAVLAVQVMLVHWQRRNWLWALFCLACLSVILLGASISGARSYSAAIVMVVIFALLLRRGFSVKPVHLIVIVLLILAFPTLLSLLREGKTVTIKDFSVYLRGVILERVVIIPMNTGLMHVHYAQTYGFLGIQAIPKIAALKGIKALNVPNFMAKMYTGDPRTTSWANTSYVYAYYSYFGLMAFIPCLIGLWLLDLCLLIYRRLSDNLLIPCVACIAINTSNFSSVEYTVSLFTFGFLFLLLVSWAVDRAVGRIVNR